MRAASRGEREKKREDRGRELLAVAAALHLLLLLVCLSPAAARISHEAAPASPPGCASPPAVRTSSPVSVDRPDLGLVCSLPPLCFESPSPSAGPSAPHLSVRFESPSASPSSPHLSVCFNSVPCLLCVLSHQNLPSVCRFSYLFALALLIDGLVVHLPCFQYCVLLSTPSVLNYKSF